MNLRASAIVMKSLPATVWGDALLISREEARRIGYELEQAAERIEALEARATPALPQVPEGMAIVPVECLEVAERAIHLLQFNTSKNAREYGAITDALNAVLAAKEKQS